MIGRVSLAAILGGIAAGTLAAEGRIQNLSPGQTVTGLRRLAVLDATASSVLGEPDGCTSHSGLGESANGNSSRRT